ncbi:MAG TPA: serine hydroxymethyltransferase [archaeon]|nr:serine hydroxymethyltransferase [archaeon]
MLEKLMESDPTMFGLVMKELERQRSGLELIPSENIPSLAVLEALSSFPHNKYSEGYPGKRYYGGNDVIDEIENLAIDRAKKLFNAEHVNVQPYSGSPANQAVFRALLQKGDTFMGLELSHGGHITHGLKINFSGMDYNAVPYHVKKGDETLDYEEIESLAKQHAPKMILCGYTAYPRIIDFKRFREIADSVSAKLFVDMSHFAGLVAGGAYPSPVPYADVIMTTTHKTLRGPRGAMILCRQEFAEKIDKAVFPELQGGPHEHAIAAKAVCFAEAMKPDFKDYAHRIITNAKALAKAVEMRLVSGGTDSHLLLADLEQKITGKEAELLLEKNGIYVNKNTIPYDSRKPWDPSGMRFGTPTLTSRGMKEKEMQEVGSLINRAMKGENVREEVRELCSGFPIYPGI